MGDRAAAKETGRQGAKPEPLLAGVGQDIQARVTAGLIRRLLLSLVLAVLLWGWVTNLENPIEPRRIPGVQVTTINRDEALFVVDEGRLPTVTAEVRGPRSSVNKLESTDLQAVVDLADVRQAGTQELPITVRAPDNVRVVGSEPRTVAITLDQQANKTFALEVDEQPAPAPFSIGNVKPATDQVEVRGPASVVGRVTRVVLPVALGDRRDTFEAQFTPEARDAAGNRVTGLTVAPATVTALVPVERVGRVVSILPTIQGKPAEGFRVVGTTVSPLSVTIDGPPDAIGQLISISTAPIDVTDRTESFPVYAVPLVLPQNTRLVDRVTVNVQVQIDTEQQSQQFQGLRVEPVGVGAGLRVTAITPPEVTISLSGPPDRIRLLRSSDIRVEVDMGGDGAGTHDKQVRISVPSGIVPQQQPIVRVTLGPAATPVPTPTATPPPTATPTPQPSPTPTPNGAQPTPAALRPRP